MEAYTAAREAVARLPPRLRDADSGQALPRASPHQQEEGRNRMRGGVRRPTPQKAVGPAQGRAARRPQQLARNAASDEGWTGPGRMACSRAAFVLRECLLALRPVFAGPRAGGEKAS